MKGYTRFAAMVATSTVVMYILCILTPTEPRISMYDGDYYDVVMCASNVIYVSVRS